MMKRLLFLTVIAAFLSTANVSAQPELDTTFNGTGNLVLQSAYFGARDMVIQPDNKIVLVSECGTALGSFGFCAVRLNPDGSYDAPFGNPPPLQHTYRLVIPYNGSLVRGIGIQSDGKLVLVGGGSTRTIVMRWHADGNMDTSFGAAGGITSTDFQPGTNERGERVLIQPDGKILVAGYTDTGSYIQFVVRFNSDGTLDSSFGSGGIVNVVLPGLWASGKSIALQRDGKILVGGTAGGAYLVTRFDPNGSLDPTWDGDGKVTFSNPSGAGDFEGVVSLAVQRDGRVLALGRLNVLFRLNADGSVDTSFDSDGWRTALTGAGTSDAYDFVVTAGGRITVVGMRPGSGSFIRDYRVARYLRDGSPDLSFSDDGFIDIDVATYDAAYTAAVDPMGRVVIAGTAGSGQIPNPFVPGVGSVVRLTAPVVPVEITGRVVSPEGRPVAGAIMTARDDTGNIWNSVTNPFGYYRIANIPSGRSYTISVRSKRFVFSERTLFVALETDDFNFVAVSPVTGSPKVR